MGKSDEKRKKQALNEYKSSTFNRVRFGEVDEEYDEKLAEENRIKRSKTVGEGKKSCKTIKEKKQFEGKLFLDAFKSKYERGE